MQTVSLDRLTRRGWRLAGRRIDLTGEHRWLEAPVSTGSRVGDGWLVDTAARWDCTLGKSDGAGLLRSLSELDGPRFAAADVRPQIANFYERTADWEMDAWNEWSPAFRPGGELISMLFGRRVQQLALPTKPLELSRGMTSRVTPFIDARGRQVAAAWLRTLKSTGGYVFSGCYRIAHLPGHEQPVVHVSFPLEAGNVQVFLEPSVDSDGSLWLRSPGGEFGDPGAYVVVDEGGTFAAQVPVHETFHLFVDDEGVPRCDHTLLMWRRPALRLHYRLRARALEQS